VTTCVPASESEIFPWHQIAEGGEGWDTGREPAATITRAKSIASQWRSPAAPARERAWAALEKLGIGHLGACPRPS
jgi:hypothetical protein